MMDVEAIKQQFPIFAAQQAAGKKLFYLDNAASSQKPQSVIDAISHCYAQDYAPVARGMYDLAESATDSYERARQDIASFIGANAENLVFTRSATESINMVAEGAIKPMLSAGDEVWVTKADHHANYLPWLRICDATGASLRTLDIDENGKLVLPPLKALKSGRVKCLAMPLISNVLGYIADVPAIVEQVSSAGIVTVIDAAQAVANHSINVTELGCDYLAFSGHKMYGPSGIGVLYISPERINQITPFLVGGGMVDWVGETIKETEWTPGIAAFEAGSPNLAGAYGIAAAARFIQMQNREQVEKHIADLAISCGNAIKELTGFVVFGDESNWQSGIVTFAHDTVHAHDIAQVCSDRGVAVRAGHHCAQPLMASLGYPATVRASFTIYNNDSDLEALIMALVAAEQMFI